MLAPTTRPIACIPAAPRTIILLAVVASVLSLAAPAAAGPRAAAALALCARADALTGDAREAILDRALATAERAVEANDADADAHFAVFCALGKQLRDEGFALTAFAKLRRARAAVDRALALNPDHVPALVGKGAALIETPAIAGGNAERGRELLRRALELDPENMAAHLYLAQADGGRPLAVAHSGP
ncbi:MAG: tetratricopeptide repeat protein [bacterium]|nr:tetratricopeptide repeat protein [bacterium]